MKKAFVLLPLYSVLLKRKKRQQRFLQERFAEELGLIQKSDDTLYNKLIYYATWGVVSISEVFSDLNKRVLSHEERYLASALSILYALADYMVDELKLSHSETTLYINGKQSEDPVITWAQKLLTELQNKTAIGEYLSKAIDAQLKSKDQTEYSSPEKVRALTFEKGSLTMLLYRLLIDAPINETEKAAVLQLGYTLQLADDIIDVYDDTTDKINTTANVTDLIPVEKYFQSQIKVSKRLFFDYYGHSANTRKAFLQFELLFGISHLALQRFQKIQITHFTPTSILQQTRSKFIVDMEKPFEAFRALWTAIKS
tara:strand:+ start:203 stop:1141 length:939 start_codon:yes stop_codon:yes gene_type:complete